MDFSKMTLNELYALRKTINENIERIEIAHQKKLAKTFINAFKACKDAKVKLQLETETYSFDLNDFVCAVTMWDKKEIEL